MDPTVTPVIQPLRHIPLTLRDEVMAELKAQLDSGLIEPINASPWISNLVIVKKCGNTIQPGNTIKLGHDPLRSIAYVSCTACLISGYDTILSPLLDTVLSHDFAPAPAAEERSSLGLDHRVPT